MFTGSLARFTALMEPRCSLRCNEGRFSYFYVKFGRCIESYVVTVYAVNDTGKIYNALRKFGTLEFVPCMDENVVNRVRSNEVRLYFVMITPFLFSRSLFDFPSW